MNNPLPFFPSTVIIIINRRLFNHYLYSSAIIYSDVFLLHRFNSAAKAAKPFVRTIKKLHGPEPPQFFIKNFLNDGYLYFLVFINIHTDQRTLLDISFQVFLRQPVFDVVLNCTSQWPCTEFNIIALFQNKFFNFF